MSLRYKGAVISATPPTTTGGSSGTAPGSWTLQQQLQAQSAGTWPSPPPPNYIEDVFSTWLYTGTGSAQTITNGIDLSGQGGMVWWKRRDSTTGTGNIINDTARGAGNVLYTYTTDSQANEPNDVQAFNTNGFQIGSSGSKSGGTYVSWTFRKQPKFFDVVTYTGNGSNRTIAHNLGSTPGCIIVKRTDTTGDWQVYHNGLTSAAYSIQLNLTNAQASATTVWNSTAPTSTVFSVGTDATVNASGGTYVAYIFAHNAGGFGLTGTDNVISCGSFTTNGSGNATVSLGYEPQWVLIKKTNGAENWIMGDVMRGMSQTSTAYMYANLINAEASTGSGWLVPNATGFDSVNNNLSVNSTYIYIAIRRGPMKTPTSGTSVFSPAYASTNTSPTKVTTGFPVDMQINSFLLGTGTNQPVLTRLQGVSTTTTESGVYLQTAAAGTESPSPAYSLGWDNTGFRQFSYYDGAKSGFWNFGRAPGFFDVVCYTGTGSAQNVTHNLNAVPELWIIKDRSPSSENWQVGSTLLANTEKLVINTTAAKVTDTTAWNSTTPTAYVFTVGTQTAVNKGPGGFGPDNYVAYLFATVAGVSKVGSYTGTGATQTIDCGFTGGARFVLIKRTDSTGNWWVWDTSRGMVAGTDPRLALDLTSAETNANWVYTVSTGFQIVTTDATVNASGGSYIFLAIA